MSLFTRIKSICMLEKALKLNFAPKCAFHSMSRFSRWSPPKGSRTIWNIFSKRSQTSLKKADDVPDVFQMIYRNKMNIYLLGAQTVCIVTGGIVLMAFFLKSDFPEYTRRKLEWSPGSRPKEYEEFYYISVFVLILSLMQVMISRTPVRIYKKPGTDKYTAINYGNYLFGKERYTFRAGEISHLPETGILPWRENRYNIQTKKDRRTVILVDHYFRRPADLYIMLGEQKDPDLEEPDGIK